MRKLTLVYGENARGKTTLCVLFRSLMTGNTAPLAARKTLGQANEPMAELRIGGQTVTLQNGAWSAPVPNLMVFDSEFVHQNIYAGDHVSRDHRRNSYRVIIGAQGVQLAKQIDQLDTDIRTANTTIRDLRAQVQRHITGTVSVDDFLRIASITNVDAEIQGKVTQITAAERAIQQVAQIQAKTNLHPIAKLGLPGNIAGVLTRTVQGISQEAEVRVRQHIQDHLDAQGESWLAQGIAYAGLQNCPYCGQDLGPSNLIGLYRSYFNDEYRQLKRDVAALRTTVDAALRGNAVANLAKGLAANADLMSFWRQFADMELPQVPVDQFQTAFADAAIDLDTAITVKERGPLDLVAMPENWSDIEDRMAAANRAIDAYNQRVAEINAEIARIKGAQPQHDLRAAQIDLQQLRLAKMRHEPLVVDDCDALSAATANKTRLETLKETTKQQLDRYCQTALVAHQNQINKYLEQFNTSFRITNTRHHYVGGTPSSYFQIQINQVAVDLGDEGTAEHEPSFKTTLSAGDRSALALAYFLATARRDPNLAQQIIVLDDPFSSQDRFRRSSTQYLVAKLAQDVDQVVVLSHDPYFLKDVADNAQAVAISRLQVSAAGDAISITGCDLNAIIGCPLTRDRVLLGAYISEGQGNPLDVARAIRPVLEGHLKQAVPNEFNGLNTLGDMIAAIRIALAGTPLSTFASVVDELDQVNVYARNFHHPPGVQAPTPPIDGEELKGFAQRTLKLVGGY